MRDHTLSRWWSTCMELFLLVIIIIMSLSFVVMNSFVFANSVPDHSLQHNSSLCHDHEKLALLYFKDSFLIDCYASHPGFARPKVKSWRESSSSSDDHEAIGDCCRWDGVECDKETGHVVGLDLSSSCLSGTFPHNSTIFDLDYLQELDLSDNDFKYSRIPLAIGRLSKLTRLNISDSLFSGQIPLGISKMSNLSILDLSQTFYNNDLGIQCDMGFENLISGLTNLMVLNLDRVDISDVVPLSLRNFTSLKSLSLGHCKLYGDFPIHVFQFPNLEVVRLSSNYNLRGHLPEFPSNRPLRVLNLKDTSFSGELTPSIGNLANLTVLNLRGTRIIGSIPSSLGNLTKLTILNLYNCTFKGDLPISVTNLTQLTDLSLSYVHVRFQIMNSWLLKLRKLESLELYNMDISNQFLPAIANLTRLFWLDLRGNRLTSPLPNGVANLTELTYLDLTGNNFQGPLIPEWFSQLINLNSLYLDSTHSSVAMFDPLLKLPKLNILYVTGINLKFPPNNATINSSLPKFSVLNLTSCNLTEFPLFLHYQNELQDVDFSANNIVGPIPQWFVKATVESLMEITLDDNSITGFEEAQVSLPWNRLEALSIQRNKLQGRLPCPPTSLQIYQVSKNQLSGIIPKQICKASSLLYLDLSGNSFSGSIPRCIGPELGASLLVLNLRNNRLQGSAPHTFTRACKLKMINLSENQLEGQLPISLANCEALEVLDVGHNRLNDTFPSWLGSLPKLQAFVSRHNNFHGIIPNMESDHQFSCLRVIDLSYNFHIGDLPAAYFQNWPAMRVTDENRLEYSSSPEIDITILASIMNDYFTENYPFEITITNKGNERLYSKILSVFRVIDFSSNNFTGVIPTVLGNLRGLQALNLSNNNLVGNIPSSLANIMDLESLDLSQNMLSGKIPQQLTKLNFLEMFNVSHNRLVGLIPQGKQFNTFDSSCFNGNSALCGAPLSKTCHNTHSLSPVTPSDSNDEKEEDSMLIDWIIRLLGCASGCIVGFIIGKLYITDKHHDWFMETFGRRTKPKPKPKANRPVQRVRRNG